MQDDLDMGKGWELSWRDRNSFQKNELSNRLDVADGKEHRSAKLGNGNCSIKLILILILIPIPILMLILIKNLQV